MNSATIAPESRLYKGKDRYRWDVSPGLDHHCGICATPLHNSRAKSSCIGKHVEPCHRFHQQLHFIGRSHECKGCNHTDEMHHHRHKEILTLIRKINDLDEINNPKSGSDSPFQAESRRGSFQSCATSTKTTLSEISSDVGEDTNKMKRSGRKKAKKLALSTTSKKHTVEAFSNEDTDFISEAIHLSTYDTKGGLQGTYIYDCKQPEVEYSSPKVEAVEGFIHQMANLSVKEPSAPYILLPKQRKNVKKGSPIGKHASYRGGSRKFSPSGLSKDSIDGVDPQIFFRLNIEIKPAKNSVARKELVAKLIAAVKNDLAVLAQEEAEIDMRAQGFWRWAGKSAWTEIMKSREELDWATGQKIDAPRKDSKYYYAEFEGEGTDAGTPGLVGTTTEDETIENYTDDDLRAPSNLKFDFAVKEDCGMVAEDSSEEVEKDLQVVVKTGAHMRQKSVKDRGRVFVTRPVGGAATLRITAA